MLSLGCWSSSSHKLPSFARDTMADCSFLQIFLSDCCSNGNDLEVLRFSLHDNKRFYILPGVFLVHFGNKKEGYGKHSPVAFPEAEEIKRKKI